MSKIINVISSRAFELIRDRIANILIDELGNQFTLTSDENINASVALESWVANDKTEFPLVVVLVAKGDYGNKFQGNTHVAYSFNIDVYTSAKTTSVVRGDLAAAKNCHKLLGICSYILESQFYKTLGFTPPFISRTYFQEMNIAEPGKQDADSTMMGRLVFVVEVPETTQLATPTIMTGYETTIKIEDTDLGYFSTTP